ncbi:MAG: hypothetical protein V2B18_03750 [Pseudomonadota bacterium]
MAKRQIRIREALRDVRTGMMDTDLMAKYQLSSKGLQSLFKKFTQSGLITFEELNRRMPGFMQQAAIGADTEEGPRWEIKRQPRPQQPTVRSINASTAVNDLRAGLKDDELMRKYRLSAKGLQHLFDQLMKAGLINNDDIERRMEEFDSTVDLRDTLGKWDLEQIMAEAKAFESAVEVEPPWMCAACGNIETYVPEQCPQCGTRENPGNSDEERGATNGQAIGSSSGYYLMFPIPIYDRGSERQVGKVRDVTETYVGIMDIRTRVGEVGTFVIHPKEYAQIESVVFRAKCLNVAQVPEGAYAGFRITEISPRGLERLKALIRTFTFGSPEDSVHSGDRSIF